MSDKGQDGTGEPGGGCRPVEEVELEVGIPQGWGCLCSERCTGSARRPALRGKQERRTCGAVVGGSGGGRGHPVQGGAHRVAGERGEKQGLRSGRIGVANKAGVCMLSRYRGGQRIHRGWIVEVFGW